MAKAKARPSDPRTPDQVRMRAYNTASVAAWNGLTHAQRAAWQGYAERYFAPADLPVRDGAFGLGAFVRANTMRQILQLDLVRDAPLHEPPVRPTGLRQLAVDSEGALAFELDHGLPDVAGLMAAVRATPRIGAVAMTPNIQKHRYVCGVSPDSFLPLPPSGGALRFGQIRFPVPHGKRYGVEVRIVRVAEGIAGAAIYGDFFKELR